mgnify:FL=1
MFESFYKIKIEGKDVKRFIRMLYRSGIYFEEISLDHGSAYIKVDKENYKKFNDIKTSYNIEVIELFGISKFNHLIRSNFIFLIFTAFGIFLLYFLSNIIFDVEVIHNDKYIRDLLYSELDKYNIKKYNFVKKYEYVQKVKNEILNNYKNDIEWLEIERVGTVYKIRVDKRIINNIKQDGQNRHVVAKKNGIIMRIVAEKGEIVKKVYDYVRAGDIIISGEIYKNKEVIGQTSASGDVYAEVWYKVKVEMPISYKEEALTGRSKNVINISFLDKNINIFDFHRYNNSKKEGNTILSDFFGMFTIKYNKEYEINVKDEVNNIISEEFAFKMARKKIEDQLGRGEYIISQKKLKTVINNSTIITEVFFKVYENISSYSYF